MTIRHRPMAPKDVPECAAIIAKHPVISPRYGKRIGDLSKAWLRLLGCEAANGATVFQSGDSSRAPICCVGVTVFVSDDFVREIKAPPIRWIGPELTKRILEDNSPVLSDSECRKANSRGGLNLLVWEGCIHPDFETNGELMAYIMPAFIEVHSGFLLKEVINVQVESAARFQWTLQTGGLLWNPEAGRYEKSTKKDPEEIVRKPHLLGASREIELGWPGSWKASWIGAIFHYQPPRCGFTRSEQRMLLLALDGGTDQELPNGLKISLPTVKKMWLSVYRKSAIHLPEFHTDHSQMDATRRGKEKKRRLLAYLRQHPEELRPVLPKLLQRADGHPRLSPQ